MAEYLNPYQTLKLIKDVIPANQPVRPNFLQTYFGEGKPWYSETVNFDREFSTLNTPAYYVAPTVDAPLVNLQGFGTSEFRFAYTKEGLASPDYREINSRQIGQQQTYVIDVYANWLANVKKKLALTEKNFETLFEINAASILVTGKYTASSEFHPVVQYDFNRTVITNATQWTAAAGIVPEINLTTVNIGGGAGDRAWGTTNGTPYKDLITMCNTVKRRGQVSRVIMAENAYNLLEIDLKTNYKDAALNTVETYNRIQLHVTPLTEKFADLNYKRSLPLGNGESVDIFTYGAIWHNRDTAVATKFLPDGYVLVLPSEQKGVKLYGRIEHVKAMFEPMPRYINTWDDNKTGKMESEIHCNYMMGHTDIDTVVSWKVC